MIKSFEELEAKQAQCAKCIEGKFKGESGKRAVVLCGGGDIGVRQHSLVGVGDNGALLAVAGARDGVGAFPILQGRGLS